MNHKIIQTVIEDQQNTIKKAAIVERNISFEENGDYVLVGPRRAGKSTILYKRALDLVERGVSWNQIIFVNFDDDRLIEFGISDFQDLVLVAKEMASGNRPYYFLDEIQNIEGWEKFAMRLANDKERVYITGSNAKMLSREVESKLGGRFLSKTVYPYSFAEYLRANKADIGASSSAIASVNGLLKSYFVYGGFPDTLNFLDKKGYLASVYEKILLGDIIARHGIRNVKSMRLLVKKIAETIGNEVSYSRLYNIMRGIGFPIAKDTIMDYCAYAEEAFLLFKTENYYAGFVDKESNPRFYFHDNGILNLLLLDKDAYLLENMVAIALKRRFGEEVYYVKSPKTGIDVDFFVPDEELAIQACYMMSDSSWKREIENLAKFRKGEEKAKKLLIVTYDEKKDIEVNGIHVEAVPLKEFLSMME